MQMIKPTQRQLEFMNWEFGAFFHFGIRTFNEGHKDWDNVHMDVKTFNPTALDCEQWIMTIKKAGAKYAILTTKHHDGFALWPSAYTDYGVEQALWKGGKGDVVAEFVKACRKHDIKVGLYYSPAQFGFQEMTGKEYDDYFINQISELLGNYGKIDYLWFDGCGSGDHEYDQVRIISVIRKLQPDILIFNMWDPDVAWVGNEEGYTPLDTSYVTQSNRISIHAEDGECRAEKKFLPYECDCKIRRPNWFYSDYDENYLRSLEDLKTLYDYSIGRGGNLLLNIGPDRRGLLPDADSKRLIEFGAYLANKFSNKKECKVTRENNTYTVSFEQEVDISTIVLSENLENGQGITKFTVDYYYNSAMRFFEGKTIGHKRILQIGSLFMDTKMILKIEIESELETDLTISIY